MGEATVDHSAVNWSVATNCDPLTVATPLLERNGSIYVMYITCMQIVKCEIICK